MTARDSVILTSFIRTLSITGECIGVLASILALIALKKFSINKSPRMKRSEQFSIFWPTLKMKVISLTIVYGIEDISSEI